MTKNTKQMVVEIYEYNKVLKYILVKYIMILSVFFKILALFYQ